MARDSLNANFEKCSNDDYEKCYELIQFEMYERIYPFSQSIWPWKVRVERTTETGFHQAQFHYFVDQYLRFNLGTISFTVVKSWQIE